MKPRYRICVLLIGSLALYLVGAPQIQAQAPATAPGGGGTPAVPKPAVLKAGWRPLLDEKLTAWEIWMGVPRQTVKGLPDGTPTSASGRDGTPLGLNNDPKHVFSIRMEDGEPVLSITGEIMGGLTTLESFANYHFRAQMKMDPGGNPVTGILYDCTGTNGAFWQAWKRCFKFQLTPKDAGDLYALGGTCAEVRVVHPDRLWVFDPTGETKKITQGKIPGSTGANRGTRRPGDFEKPRGEWNTVEVYVLGRSAVHVLNGNVTMAIQNASNLEGTDQTEAPLSSGQIQIQSEAGQVYFRRVEIEPITELPPEIKKAAGL